MFTTDKFKLTPKTIQFRVLLNELVVCVCGKEEASKNIAECFNRYGVKTLSDFKKLPWNIRLAFILATSMESPCLKI